MTAFPMQPVEIDEDGKPRFRENRIVRLLLEEGPHNLNSIAEDANARRFTCEEMEQLAQLIGYSVGGFGELSFASDEAVAKADKAAATLMATTRLGTDIRCGHCDAPLAAELAEHTVDPNGDALGTVRLLSVSSCACGGAL